MPNSNKKSLVLHTHTGLGDHIITNGMVHSFTEDYDKVYVPHITAFSDSINALYKGYDKVEPVALPDIDINLDGRHLIQEIVERTNSEYICVADPLLYYPERLIVTPSNNIEARHVATNFERQFYELAGMHFSIRFTHARIPESTEKSLEIYKQLTNEEDFILVHDISSINVDLPVAIDQVSKNKGLPIVKIVPGISNNIFDFVDLIKNAKEIHVIPSSFFCIVDSLFDKTSAELFLHNVLIKFDSQTNCQWNNNRWNIIEYRHKY